MVVCYALFYISTVFSLSYGTTTLGIQRPQFLGMLCVSIIFMAVATPLAAWAGDRYGRRPVLLVAGSAAFLSGFLLAPMLGSGSPWQITAFLGIELFLMGATFAPMGALLPELFQPRYVIQALARLTILAEFLALRSRLTSGNNWCCTAVSPGWAAMFLSQPPSACWPYWR